MNVMMTLGGFQFGTSTAAYQELNRITEYRWPSQDRFLQDPALQFVGPGGDTFNLPGVIYPEWNGGTGQLDALRAMASRGVPHTMIDGRGNVLGDWVIERIEEKGTVFAQGGAPRKQEFTVSIRKFSSPGIAALAAQVLGSAAIGSLPVPTSALASLDSLTLSVGSQAGGFVSSLTSAMNQVTGVAGQLGSAASSVLSPVGRAIDVATGLKTAATDAKRLLGSVPTTLSGISSATSLVSAASTAVNNAGAAGAMLNRSLTSLTALGTVSSDAIGAVRNAMTTVNQLTVAATQTHATATNLLGALNG